jgi:hypothetical protein
MKKEKKEVLHETVRKQSYWFLLHRKSNKEDFFYGVPGVMEESKKLQTFVVKTGIPGERPTPLPQLLGKEYWVITAKEDSSENPETAPFFLTLNIPSPTDAPYGPVPYSECDGPASTQRGEQCDWVLPGAFGLHGIAGNPEKLSASDPGSSGCIRHRDEDITYLYNTLDPEKEEIRYYIEDN